MAQVEANPHFGTFLDDFLKEEGIYDEITALVIGEKFEWQRAARESADVSKSYPRRLKPG